MFSVSEVRAHAGPQFDFVKKLVCMGRVLERALFPKQIGVVVGAPPVRSQLFNQDFMPFE